METTAASKAGDSNPINGYVSPVEDARGEEEDLDPWTKSIQSLKIELDVLHDREHS
jgi:hypothetical protein